MRALTIVEDLDVFEDVTRARRLALRRRDFGPAPFFGVAKKLSVTALYQQFRSAAHALLHPIAEVPARKDLARVLAAAVAVKHEGDGRARQRRAQSAASPVASTGT